MDWDFFCDDVVPWLFIVVSVWLAINAVGLWFGFRLATLRERDIDEFGPFCRCKLRDHCECTLPEHVPPD